MVKDRKRSRAPRALAKYGLAAPATSSTTYHQLDSTSTVRNEVLLLLLLRKTGRPVYRVVLCTFLLLPLVREDQLAHASSVAAKRVQDAPTQPQTRSIYHFGPHQSRTKLIPDVPRFCWTLNGLVTSTFTSSRYHHPALAEQLAC